MILLALAIVGLFAYGYFTSTLPPPLPALHRTTAPETTTPAQGNPQAQTASTGKPFAYGDVVYTVGSVSRVTEVTNGTTSFKAAGIFIEIPLTLANSSRTPIAFAAADFSLRDSQSRVFSLHEGATALASAASGKTDLFAEGLQPGLEIDTVLVFDVPDKASGLGLRISAGFMDVTLGQ